MSPTIQCRTIQQGQFSELLLEKRGPNLQQERRAVKEPAAARSLCHHPPMKPLMFTAIVLSLIVLGAHFLRTGSIMPILAMLALAVLLLVRRAWVARLVQIVLVLGALEWVRTLITLARWRSEQGEPFLRMAVILGIVAAVTFASAMFFQSSSLRSIYRSEEER
jgi:hypothetical protein